MPTIFRAIGKSSTPSKRGNAFEAVVQFVQVNSGPPARTIVLREDTITATSRADLVEKCEARLARLKRAQEDADRALDIDGKTLAEVEA
ncbi:MAG: hypothetical protein AB7O67_23230 [Vicinamibacterales bacterium]